MKQLKFWLVMCFLPLVPSLLMAKWEQTSGPTGGEISALALSGSTLYAGTHLNGVFKSTDLGKHWTEMNAGLSCRWTSGLAVHGDTLSVITGWDGAYVSLNGGADWSKASPGSFDLCFSYQSMYSSNQKLYHVGLMGVWQSDDYGITWHEIVGNNDSVKDINSSIAGYQDTLFVGNRNGFFLKGPSDTKWIARTGILPPCNKLGIRIIGAQIFTATDSGIFRSPDRGLHWEKRSNGFTESQISFITNVDSVLYASTFKNSYQSTDWGNSWNKTFPALSETGMSQICQAGTQIFIATTNKGIFTSINANQTLTPCNTGLIATNISSFAQAGNRLLAAEGEGLFFSENDGNDWVRIESYTPHPKGSVVRIIDGRVLLLGWNGIFFSDNEGTSWSQPLIHGTDTSFNGLVSAGGKLIASTYDGLIYTSSDRGSQWYKNYNLTTISSPMNSTVSIPILSCKDKLFFKNDTTGLWTSNDFGSTWETLGNTTSKNLTNIVSTKNRIYGQSLNTIVYSNDGSFWKSVNSPFSTSTYQRLFSDETNVFIASEKGLYVLDTISDQWRSIGSGLDLSVAQVKSLYANSKYLFLGMDIGGGGVWRRALSEMAFSASHTAHASFTPQNCSISSISIKNASLIISYSTAKYSDIMLRILNMQGQIIDKVAITNQAPGNHVYNWRNLTCAKGTYYCQINTNNEMRMKKISLLQ